MYSKYKSSKEKLILMTKGLAMGTADIIPGVSGGTIALISGIYDHFIGALDSVRLRHALSLLRLLVFFWDSGKRRTALEELGEIEWQFLLPLFAGILLALLVMIQIIPYIMEHYAFYAFSFFFGLIVFSISVPYKRMEHRWQEFLTLIVFACFTFVIVAMSRVSDVRIDFEPNAIPNMENTSETAGNVSLRANQKGQWELLVPVDSLLDSADPRCPDFRCLLLPAGGPALASLGPRDRARVFTATVFAPSGERLGAFRLLLAMPDLPFSDFQKQQEAGKQGLLRAEVLESDLGDLRVFVKKINRVNKAESDMLAVKASLASEKGHSLPFLFFSGALAICAMVLPGISGAYILVLLGQYQYVTSLARNFLHNGKELLLNSRTGELLPALASDGISLVVFVSGIAIGLFTFVRILKFVLSRYHSLAMAALTGLMMGSLRYIWPPKHYEGAALSLSDWGAFVGIALFGAIVVFLLEFAASRLHDPDAPLD